MEKLFVEPEENRWMTVLFFILTVTTFGLVWLFLYDELFQRKYMVNRRRLINAINNGEITLVKRLPIDPQYFSDIEMFDLIDQNGDRYDLWLWTRTDGVIKANVADHIGLFTASFLAKRLNDKLVKTIRAEING